MSEKVCENLEELYYTLPSGPLNKEVFREHPPSVLKLWVCLHVLDQTALLKRGEAYIASGQRFLVSFERLARFTGLSLPTVKKNRRVLEKMGLLETGYDHRRDKEGKRSTEHITSWKLLDQYRPKHFRLHVVN